MRKTPEFAKVDASSVERLVVDAETGLRGYLITGEPRFLQPTLAAERRPPAAYAALRQAAASAGVYEPAAQALIGASSAYLSGYLRSELSLAQRDLAKARSVAATQLGKDQVDAIRARTAALEDLLAARQSARQAAARHTANHSITEAIVLLVLLTGLTLLLGGYLGHMAVQRQIARDQALETTRTLQQSILPPRVPEIPGCELAIRFRPIGGGLVGGDFYDVYEVVPGSWAVIVGDVCGKGAEAAAVSAMARWTLRSLIGASVAPADALRFLNESMLHQAVDARFITLAYLRITVEGKTARAEVACAGHPPPVIVPAGGEPAPVDAAGDLLGVWHEIRLHTAELRLSPSDAVVLFTDGITEQGPGEPAEPDRLLADRPADADAKQLASALEDRAIPSRGEPRDDIAIVALRFLGEDAGGDPAGARWDEQLLAPVR
jgi:serine phosphatase RsbU (regulator of sigma subunit)